MPFDSLLTMLLMFTVQFTAKLTQCKIIELTVTVLQFRYCRGPFLKYLAVWFCAVHFTNMNHILTLYSSNIHKKGIKTNHFFIYRVNPLSILRSSYWNYTGCTVLNCLLILICKYCPLILTAGKLQASAVIRALLWTLRGLVNYLSIQSWKKES